MEMFYKSDLSLSLTMRMMIFSEMNGILAITLVMVLAYSSWLCCHDSV